MLREKNVVVSAEKALATLMNNYFVHITADFGYFKTWGTPMEYPIGVPTGVHLYCSIWTSFWNILISYFIYSVVKAWSKDEVSSRKLTEAEPRFRAIDTWSSPQKNLILTLRYLCQNFRYYVVALIEVEHFRIVTHYYAASVLRKLILC